MPSIKTPFTVTVQSNRAGEFTVRVCASGPHSDRAQHDRTAAAYRIAAELELIAGAEALAYKVDGSYAREGVVPVSPNGVDLDIMFEVVVDAVSNAGFIPTP